MFPIAMHTILCVYIETNLHTTSSTNEPWIGVYLNAIINDAGYGIGFEREHIRFTGSNKYVIDTQGTTVTRAMVMGK